MTVPLRAALYLHLGVSTPRQAQHAVSIPDGGVLGSALAGACWYCSGTAFALALCRLAAVRGGMLAVPEQVGRFDVGDNVQGRIQIENDRVDVSYLGFPVLISAKLPDVTTTLTGR
jgi:hypothetical protein